MPFQSQKRSGSGQAMDCQQVTLWIHDEKFSKDEVLVAPDILGQGNIPAGALIEIVMLRPSCDLEDTQDGVDMVAVPSERSLFGSTSRVSDHWMKEPRHPPMVIEQDEVLEPDPRTCYCCIAKPMPPEIRASHPTLQVSLTNSIANTFGYRQRAQAEIRLVDPWTRSASHVELTFRDEYLSRSDMWRMVRSELAGKTVHKGQKIVFLGTIKATVKTIFVHERTASSAYFCETTSPVFRSESARYVLFVQMSREMWDFDSEGTGEILFSRVIDGFLPELFKKWVELEAKHLVSIVLFSRLEYDRHALAALQRLNSDAVDRPTVQIDEEASYRDFYRVVVTDMASGQWTTILNELKRDFRIFLRDITLHQPQEHNFNKGNVRSDTLKESRTRICGRPTSALRGNILEAINIASSQFASDYIDRDLIRTGISVIVITPGTGVFEVDQQLLNLTSENLTNNGIAIDLVCLSKMPLHSVPLFRWSKDSPKPSTTKPDGGLRVESLPDSSLSDGSVQAKPVGSPFSNGSLSQSTPRGRATSMIPERQWSHGVPQWIDVSYWASDKRQRCGSRRNGTKDVVESYLNPLYSRRFVPRVRMYELQMMGIMELGLANISVPYLSERRNMTDSDRNQHNAMLEQKSKASWFGHSTSSPYSPRTPGSAHRFNRRRGLLSVQAKQQGDMYERMDVYDDDLFKLDRAARTTKVPTTRGNNQIVTGSPLQVPHWNSLDGRRSPMLGLSHSGRGTGRSAVEGEIAKSDSPDVRSGRVTVYPMPSESRISRAISFALRGLGPSAPRAVASTEINIENARADQTAVNLTSDDRPLSDSSKSLRSPVDGKSKRLSKLSIGSGSSEAMDLSHAPHSEKSSASRPILIKKSEKHHRQSYQAAKMDDAKAPGSVDVQRGAHGEEPHARLGSIKALSASENTDGVELSGGLAKPVDVPVPDISPWIKIVNPANPATNHPKAAFWLGRWQHLYPQTPKASTVKWKSLCTPASIPLTTEEFPDKEEWKHQYLKTSYVVSQHNDNHLAESSRSCDWLLREMIGLRLSHGYQLIVGSEMAKVVGSEAAASVDPFAPEQLARDGAEIFMSMGNTVQRLLRLGSGAIEVDRFVRRPPEARQAQVQSVTYCPVIRTILSESYFQRTMKLAGFSEEYPWSLADSYIAGQKKDLVEVYEGLRFWRARFVVIPVEPPPNARRPVQSMSEDNEEEIHLLGIRELTKMWQKIRFTPHDERRFKPTSGKKKGPNPLEINFQTLNPSEVVATEIEKLLATDEGVESKQIQLLPESELLERSTSSLSKIAQVLQSEKGVEIANRRWHLKLHYSCFKGDDFTNWLISSFKDIDSRDEAVNFGNELKQHGLFQHVSTRHTFKDGNYFYAIAPEHRISRSESRSSWFPSGRRLERSVPATPVAEAGAHLSPLSNQSHSGLTSIGPLDTHSSEKESSEKRQVSVSLTKMMRVDVDHRNPKRSDRPEIVNLHYDRLHNPENCYHFELSWFNVTSKLVEDAMVSWATQSEKYGLRIVEVPIAEACSITDREPFRAPYRIRLKVAPPAPGHSTSANGPAYFTHTSFAPQVASSTDDLVFQKALLKKFNFVLDLEAASEFPPDVDVTYTWGQFSYRYSQFVHRSGVVLAQVTDKGELFLLANRLYNTRSASAKDVVGKFEGRKSSHQRPTPASGIVGLNPQNPSPHPSPMVRASSDVLGSRDGLNGSGTGALITPEQIKDELEEFCNDVGKLQAFYKEVSDRGPAVARKSGSSSSSGLRPVAESGLESSIPDLRLPASLVNTTTATARSLAVGLAKRSSPQTVARDKAATDTAGTTSSPRTSVNSG